MQRVKENDFVTVLYDGLLKNGEAFESSKDTGPLSFQVGNNEVFTAFEDAVIGMAEGETRSITLPPEKAYGAKRPELIHTVDRAVFGKKEIKQGLVVGMTMEKDGHKHQVPALITEIDGNTVTVDFNHPLAGEELTFKITLQSIDQPPAAMPQNHIPSIDGGSPSSGDGSCGG